MTNGTTPEATPAFKMTMRVYSVTRAGLITRDRGTVNVPDRKEAPFVMGGFPPCACPRCASRKRVTAR